MDEDPDVSASGDINDEVNSFRLLLECQSSKRQVTCNSTFSKLPSVLELELKKVAGDCAKLVLDVDDVNQPHTYLLQRYSTQWMEYIDVISPIEIASGDKLRAVPLAPKKNSAESEATSTSRLNATKTAASILSKVKKPTQAEAKAISQMFSTSKNEKKRPFDPLADSIVEPQKKKKKRAIPSKKSKPTNLKVFMLDKQQNKVPKGEVRKRLEKKDQVQIVAIYREMDSDGVKEAILNTFKWVHSYSILSCESGGHSLIKSSDQSPSGEDIIKRRGPLYLAINNSDDYVALSDSSEESDLPDTRLPGSKSIAKSLKRTNEILNKIRQTPALSSSESDDCIEGNRMTTNPPGSTSRAYIEESRRIREEQDQAYAESLRIDQEKELKAREKENRECLRAQLKAKWNEEKLQGSTELPFSLRLPNMSKLDCCLSSSNSSTDLYEIAFAYYNDDKSFSLYTLRPRQKLPLNKSIVDVNLEPRTVLILEEDVEAADPLDYLSSSSKIGNRPEVNDVVTESTSIGYAYAELEDYDAEISQLFFADLPKEAECLEIVTFSDTRRMKFIKESLHTRRGMPHSVRQDSEHIFDDVIALYRNSTKDILYELPFRIRYIDGRACDIGGVARDMFSAFWEVAYVRVFDGGDVVSPAIHPHMDMAIYPVLGTIISHGYISCGFLPIRLSFPTLLSCLKGPCVQMPDSLLLESFLDYVSTLEGTRLHKALNSKNFSDEEQSDIVSILSRFGCRVMPTATNLRQLLIQVAKHELLLAPVGALYALKSGVPVIHHTFWDQFSVSDLYKLYKVLNATPAQVIKDIEEPLGINKAEERVFGFLITYVGNMSIKTLRLFLRFITGSSVRIGKKIKVEFNNLTGFARRPTVHTCDCILELPITYSTSMEFAHEFDSLLSNEYAWAMDVI